MACAVATRLMAEDMTVRLLADEAPDLDITGAEVVAADGGADDCELAVVIGGDGTILRGAALARLAGTPLLGINLGHVGFLAEAEWDDLESTVDAIISGRYAVEERLTVDVTVSLNGEILGLEWALNEASIEKAARQRMIEVVIEVDDRPLSRWGCDGVVVATPTGSTAYAFSAGGPVMWPEVDALLLVPISAHALFARPLVTSPGSILAVELLPISDVGGVLWCDGRRQVELPPGARVEVSRGKHPIRLARLHEGPLHGPARRQVRPPRHGLAGGRGTSTPSRRGGLGCLRSCRSPSLGVIDDAALEFGPGLNVVTGETGAGKTMVVTALGLLLGARADSGAVRQGSDRARVEGRVRIDPESAVARRALDAGADLDDDSLILARTVTAEGRSRASAGGAGVPAALLSGLAADLVAVHGQSDQQLLLSPSRQRDHLDAFGGADLLAVRRRYRATFDRLRTVTAEIDAIVGRARERAQEADLLRFGLEEIAAVTPRAGEDAELLAEELRLGHVDGLRRAADEARLALSGDDEAFGEANALALVAAARKSLDSERDHDARLSVIADDARGSVVRPG